MRRSILLRLSGSSIALMLVLGLFGWLAQPVRADATITINTTSTTVADDDECSIYEAFENAADNDQTHDDCVAGTDGVDTIVFHPLLTGIIFNLTAVVDGGTDSGDLIIEGNFTGVNMGALSPFIVVRSDNLTINNFSIIDGSTGGFAGGAIHFSSDTDHKLSINNSVFAFNAARHGGVIQITGDLASLQIRNSTFSQNLADRGSAIYIDSPGSHQIIQSTFTGNSANVSSAIYVSVSASGAELNIHNSTITANVHSGGTGNASLFTNTGTTTNISNSIVATTTGETDCLGNGTFTSLGYNIFGDGTDSNGCPTGGTGDITEYENLSDILNTTLTKVGTAFVLPLVKNSLAINTGNPDFDANSFDPALSLDQTGTVARVINERVDIGAVEYLPDTDAANDAVSIGENAAATAVSVLENDQGGDLEIIGVITTGVTITTGAVELSSGTITYNPNGKFESLDSGENANDYFSYSVEGADGETDSAQVTVTIDGANDAPQAESNSFTTAFQTAVSGNVLTNDTDVDEEDLDVTGATQPSHAKSFSLDTETGAFSYTPADNFSGTDSFTYKATDGTAESNVATVSITVGEDPTTAPEDTTPPQIISITADPSSGNFVAGQKITIIITFSEPATLTGGSMTITFSTGHTVTIPPFANKTVVTVEFIIPSGFGDVFNVAAPSPLDVISIALPPGASLSDSKGNTSGGGSSPFTFPLPTGQSLADNTEITIDTSIISADGACPTIAGLTVTEADGDAPEAPAYMCVIPNQGRPTIVWRNDPRADWFNIWIGNGQGTVLYDWFPRQAPGILFGDMVATKAVCAGLTCTLKPDINPLAGSYEVWMQAWGTPTTSIDDGLYSTGGSGENLTPPLPSWNGGSAEPASQFSYSATRSGPVTPLTPTIASGGEVSLRWTGVDGATWYNVWMGTAPSEFSPRVYVWASAEDLGCENGGTCTLTKDTEFIQLGGSATFDLTADEYIFYVQSWGPAGFNTGGIEGTSWVPSETFEVP